METGRHSTQPEQPRRQRHRRTNCAVNAHLRPNRQHSSTPCVPRPTWTEQRNAFQEALQLVHRGHDIAGRIRSRGVREPALFLQASKEVCALRRDLRRLRRLRRLFIQLRERDGHPRGEGEGGTHRPYRCYRRRATVNDSLPARTVGSIESIPLNPTIGIQRSEKLSILSLQF